MEELRPDDPYVIGPYRVLARLGAGGMGRVYLARSVGGRTVAVKTVRGELAQQEEFRTRFAREVRAARKVEGPWTAPVLDADMEGPVPWVATGYVPGLSLEHVVGRSFGPLPEDTLRGLGAGLAQALDTIHGAGIVHRDLKPSNVLLAVDGPRVVDFGIARAWDTAPGEAVTRTGAVIGSPGFMAPEQVRGGEVAPASDIFCLGAVLAYAATGRPPFGSVQAGVHALLYRVVEEEPDLAGIPEWLAHVVRDCLAKSPEQRPSVADVLNVCGPFTGQDWLPRQLTAELARLSGQLLDLDGPGPESGFRPPRHDEGSPAASEASAPDTAGPAPAPATGPAADATTAAGAPTSSPRGGAGRFRHRVVVPAAALAVAAASAAGLWLLGPLSDTGGDGGNGGAGGAASDDPDDAPLPRAYLGSWKSVIKGGPALVRLTVGENRGGQSAVTYLLVHTHTLCQGTSRLRDVGDTRVLLEDATVTRSVPADDCPPPAEQSLRLGDDGELVWTVRGKPRTLRRADDTGTVDDAFLGTWKATGKGGASGGALRVTVRRGSVGAAVARLRFDSGDGRRCEMEDVLVAQDESHLAFGPMDVDRSRSDDGCEAGAAHTYVHRGTDRMRLTFADDTDPAVTLVRTRR
ncbi:serine/threonine-protein kinase [Streptomyces longispororuber]|uniref:serine/threonine-protein kinase n=1 Tax=Streptomyces longispororuber TaxID=68230 RepID=UPI0034115992